MFGFASDTPDINCPNCNRPMVDMKTYQKALQDGIGVGADSSWLIGAGRNRTINPFAVAELIGNIVDSILDFFRNKKAAKLCEQVLPEYPKSQMCVLCLFVYKRK